MNRLNSLKKLMVGLCAAVLSTSVALAATPTDDVMVPVRQFVDAFNSGDTKAALATYAPGVVVIVDEFAPFRWVGAHALVDWSADYDKHAKATGVTEGMVRIEAATRTEIDGDKAYVVVPAVYLYKENGKATAEEANILLVLKSVTGKWKITSWTWTGVKPHPAK